VQRFRQTCQKIQSLAVNFPFKTDRRQVEMVFGQLPHQKAANCHIKKRPTATSFFGSK
jgi:hypothetical protein